MQSIAFELGIAETAFLVPGDGPTTFALRWFSPATEIDLCGHATLASAHALRQWGSRGRHAPLTFHTRAARCTPPSTAIAWSSTSRPTRSVPRRCPTCLEGQWAGSVLSLWPDSSLGSSSCRRLRPCAPTSLTSRPLPPRRQGAPPHGGGGPGLRRRLRAAGVRAQRRHIRGPGHGLGPVLGGPVLGRGAGAE